MADEINLKIPLADILASIKARKLFYQRYPFGDLVCIVKVFHKDYKSPRRRVPSRRRNPGIRWDWPAGRKALPASPRRRLGYDS